MANEKLTYYQICHYLASGSLSMIPAGYNIIYNHKPGKVFNLDIDLSKEMNKLSIVDNKFPKPQYIRVDGEYKIHIPHSFCCYSEEYGYNKDYELVEYRDVYVRTDFELSKLQFIYEYGKPETEQAKDKIYNLFDSYFRPGGFVPKREIVFDCTLDLPEFKLDINNMLPKSADDIEAKTEEGLKNYMAVDFDYDFFHTTFN